MLYSAAQRLRSTNASTLFATLGILGFFEFTALSGKFRPNLHSSKRVMQALNGKWSFHEFNRTSYRWF
ncbi:hypothetical protein C9J22_20360 [Photobacterium phosphoreum]|nr:hypothetical protein C9J22_20360 [Photobacterium phosphoreum]